MQREFHDLNHIWIIHEYTDNIFSFFFKKRDLHEIARIIINENDNLAKNGSKKNVERFEAKYK